MENQRSWILTPIALLLLLGGLLLVAQTMAAAPLPGEGIGEIQTGSLHTAAASSWNSGWIIVTAGSCQQLDHNLGGDPNDYAVEL